ncbi:MAG TPA: response regulator [Bryobacteraceae bacterium]|nr:response regulator [Bryobacteraceae bacterium]
MSTLNLLLVEDDKENLALLKATLPTTLKDHALRWSTCDSFDAACDQLRDQHFDVVVTDVYRDRKATKKTSLAPDDAKGVSLLDEIRKHRFCPVVFFSDGSRPENITLGLFVRFADKSKNNDKIVQELTGVLETGIPTLAAKLHEELDRATSSYLWEFLEKNWDRLTPTHTKAPEILERLIRRRAAIVLGHLDPTASTPTELDTVEAAEFYLYPPISGKEYRLGDVLKHGDEYRIVLVPHCYLTVQKGEAAPRADYLVTAKTMPAAKFIEKHPFKKGEKERQEQLRRTLNSPVDAGQPKGRYWFVPGFLDIPDLFCDFLQLDSIAYGTVSAEYKRLATLAPPYSEALQTCYLKFYTAVGIPSLQTERYQHFFSTGLGKPAAPPEQPAPEGKMPAETPLTAKRVPGEPSEEGTGVTLKTPPEEAPPAAPVS